MIINNGKIGETYFEYRIINNKKPLIIFLHGFLCNKNIFDNFNNYLYDNKINFIKIDFRGFGKSKDAKNISFKYITQDIYNIITDKKFKKFKIKFITYSMGSLILYKLRKNFNDINNKIINCLHISPILNFKKRMFLYNVLIFLIQGGFKKSLDINLIKSFKLLKLFKLIIEIFIHAFYYNRKYKWELYSKDTFILGNKDFCLRKGEFYTKNKDKFLIIDNKNHYIIFDNKLEKVIIDNNLI